MIPRIPDDPVRRDRRKADLLLASQILRGQAALDLDDLGGRADVWGRRWLWAKGWLTDPIVLAVAGGGAALFAASGRSNRSRVWRWARWAWVAWKAYQRR